MSQHLRAYTLEGSGQFTFALSLGSLCNRNIILASKSPTMKSFWTELCITESTQMSNKLAHQKCQACFQESGCRNLPTPWLTPWAKPSRASGNLWPPVESVDKLITGPTWSVVTAGWPQELRGARCCLCAEWRCNASDTRTVLVCCHGNWQLRLNSSFPWNQLASYRSNDWWME